MREFLLKSEELLNKEAVAFLEREGQLHGLFPCSWIYYNERIKLAFFTEPMETIGEREKDMNLDEACRTAQNILTRVQDLENYDEVSLENVIWDPDSIYVDDKGQIFLICLPAQVPPESSSSGIYKKRIYALIEDLLSEKDGGIFVCRQIDYQKEKAFGDWTSLSHTLTLRAPEENQDDSIVLHSINTPSPVSFRVGHEKYRIGSDPNLADGVIEGAESVDPVHALIGWNGINYYVSDEDSEGGTYVNGQKITANTEVPIGEGSVLRFADYTFNVE